MPRFYFDIHDGQDFIDDAGLELPDVATAQGHALRALTEMVQWIGSDWDKIHVTVRDDHSVPVLRLSAKVEIERVQQPAMAGTGDEARPPH